MNSLLNTDAAIGPRPGNVRSDNEPAGRRSRRTAVDGGRRRFGFGRTAEARRWTAQVLVVVMVVAVVPVALATPAEADVPANDSFAGALSLSSLQPIRISGSVAMATKEPGEPVLAPTSPAPPSPCPSHSSAGRNGVLVGALLENTYRRKLL